MIRVRKSVEAPLSLNNTRAYDGEDVKKQLLADQDSKCYLCERVLITEFEIEHLKSQYYHPELRQEWTNLLLVCSYCNGKKGNTYDDTISPIDNNIEDILKQTIDFDNAKVIFEVVSTSEISYNLKLVDLLGSIFNGKGKIRKIKEENFFENFVMDIRHFQSLVVGYLCGKSEYRRVIEDELSICNEFLGFKHWIIKGNKTLFDDFSSCIVWNK